MVLMPEFKDEILEICEKFLFDPDCISLHIRRGDYVNLQHFHPLVAIDYYKNALTPEWHSRVLSIMADQKLKNFFIFNLFKKRNSQNNR